MPQLNFSPQFAPKVESREKRQTIRATRKAPIKNGDTLHIFTGLRTKKARRLLPPQECTQALDIVIRRKALKNSKYIGLDVRLQFAGKLTRERIEKLAREDGFDSVEAFTAWFLPEGRDEFKGQLIKWNPDHG
ncbi:hypothetical protein [Prosthecobacter sp.]|uniref:hypothetical protein n=1 Tax=Prosthecobacter sp. TaxID=1965333 RepID=UPI00378453F4